MMREAMGPRTTAAVFPPCSVVHCQCSVTNHTVELRWSANSPYRSRSSGLGIYMSERDHP
jgi:hypothetical protein